MKEDDFRSKDDFEYWVEHLEKLFKLTDPEDIIHEVENNLVGKVYYFKDVQLQDEVRDELYKLISINIRIKNNLEIDMSEDEIINKAEYFFTKKLGLRSFTKESGRFYLEGDIFTIYAQGDYRYFDRLEKKIRFS